MNRIIHCVCFVIIWGGFSQAQSLKDPSFEEVISLQSVSSPVISPDGQHVVFSLSSTDWKENRFDRELWLSKNGGTPFPLTYNPKQSSFNPKWSPDGQWIAFLANRSGKTQIHVIRVAGGEAFPLSHTEGNISNFAWSPDGKQIAFLQAEDKEKAQKKRKDTFGAYAVEDAEYSLQQLWLMGVNLDQLSHQPLPAQLEDSTYKAERKPALLIDSAEFTINSFRWSPDGRHIAFDHQPDPLITSFLKRDISVYNCETKTHRLLVNHASFDGLAAWSPDGQSLLYQSALDDNSSNFYRNGNLFRIQVDGTGQRQLARDFDENINIVAWRESGIYGVAWQKTLRVMVRVDPIQGGVILLPLAQPRISGLSLSQDGKRLTYTAAGDDELPEVYMSDFPLKNVRQLTQISQQIEDWKVAKSEVISWKSEDGATIEGVLHKPRDYDPQKSYPLLVVIHGGPTGISTPGPAPAYVYPMIQWLNKGALVLRPNYRGSAGYGEAFRSLNVRNLGVGDAWDVESGVKFLIEKGLVDSNKVGSMGWSQGGYISAFLATNSDLFQAISVGAGISNWMTYYVNTDIHPFTRQYLKATPWSDPEIYARTSPMTHINQASTPTLIQHGEFDRRVPPANAFELYQGLQDVGVETKLIIYKGFGHGITKPKERLAAMWHNWQWFAKYIWEEEIALPVEE